MELPYDLINKFTSVTVKNPYADNRKVAEYGTIKDVNGEKFVQLDGSNLLTPFITVSDVKDKERVSVEVIDHQAIIKGNITNPSIGVHTVDGIVTRIDGDIEQTNEDLDKLRKEAEAERKRIEAELTVQIDLAKKAAKEADDHAAAAEKVSTDYIEAKPGDGFYVGTSDTSEYHVHINAGGIQIRKGYSNPLVLSKWTAGELTLGQSENFHTSMKVDGFRLRGPNKSKNSIVDYMTVGLNGMSLTDADGKEYSNYTTTSFRIGYSDEDKVNVYGTNTAIKFRKGSTVLSEYALNQIRIGPTTGTNKNIVINQNGITLRQASTNLANFTANEINLGSNSSSSVIKLCGSKGSLDYGSHSVDYDSYGDNHTYTTLEMKSDRVSLKSDYLVYMNAKSGTSPASLFVQSFGSGFMIRGTGIVSRGNWSRIEYFGSTSLTYKSEFFTDQVKLVEFRDFTKFNAYGDNVSFTADSFKYNGVAWETGSEAAVLNYENQLKQSEAITSLYENQLRQDEAIVALYEASL